MSNKALLITKQTPAVDILKKLLEENDYTVECIVRSSLKALELAKNPVYDVAVINAPIDDGNGIDVAVNISKDTVCGVILLVQADKSLLVSKNVADYGVVVVPKPINRMLFKQSLGVVRAAKKRYAGLSEENDRLKTNLEETKIINRAKLLLMQYLSLSAERAHKYIEKQSTDMHISRLEVARQILRTYVSR